MRNGSAWFIDYERQPDGTVGIMGEMVSDPETLIGIGISPDAFEQLSEAMADLGPVPVTSGDGVTVTFYPPALRIRFEAWREMVSEMVEKVESNPGLLVGLLSGEIEYHLTADGAEMVYPDLEE